MAPLWILSSLLVATTSGMEPHVHGEAQLSITADGTTLITEFTSDQHTLFGFEGEAKTEREEEYAEAISDLLTAPNVIFMLETSVPCTMTSTEVDTHDDDDGGLGGHNHHDHHDEHDHHDAHDEHRDVVVRSVFTCDADPTITSVFVTAYEEVGGLNSVDIVVLTDRQQAEKHTHRNDRGARFP